MTKIALPGIISFTREGIFVRDFARFVADIASGTIYIVWPVICGGNASDEPHSTQKL